MVDRLTKRRERRERYLKIFMERGEDAIDEILDLVLIKIRRYSVLVRTDRSYIPRLRHNAHIYEDLLLSGIFEPDQKHWRFIARLKARTTVSTEEKMYRRVMASQKKEK